MLFYQVCWSANPVLLHTNKHFYTVGERIWFTGYFNSDREVVQNESYVCKLLQIAEEHQKMVKAVKIAGDQHHVTGYLDIPDHLNSGWYALFVFPQENNYDIKNAIIQKLLIYNPNDPFAEEDIENLLSDKRKFESGPELNSYGIKVNLKKDITGKNNMRFTGTLKNDIDDFPSGIVSIAVVDKVFINDALFQRSLDIQQITTPDSSKLNNINYIIGNLKIDNEPASIKKVYFFAYQDKEVILDKYITSREGDFYFPNTSFQGEFDVKFLSYPDNTATYDYSLANQSNLDSIYYLGIKSGNFHNINELVDISNKEYLINQSYAAAEIVQDSIIINISHLVKASKTVILDEYIDFSTLPEVIREIVPYTTIRYKKGQYILRIGDQRAKDFCCKDDPLIFVNNEPYLEVSEIMKIKPKDVYSIEVIRPIEAITAFGDIGANGILLINLKEDIGQSYMKSKGKAYFRLLGHQVSEKYTDVLDETIPDFRSFIYWEGGIKTNAIGQFNFEFKPSLRQGNYCIVICGRTDDGELFYDIQSLF